MVYTRYADDLTFSSAQEFHRKDATRIIGSVDRIASSCNFILHRKKTRIITPGARKIVLGLLVDDDHLRLSPETKRKITTHVRGVEVFGLPAHSTHRDFASPFGFVRYVEGLLAFAHDVDPAWTAEMTNRWATALQTGGWNFPDLRRTAAELEAM